MSTFIDEVGKYQKELRVELGLDIEENFEDYFNNATYKVMCSTGLCQPYTMRLPVHIIAQLDELKKYTPHSSKGEMLFKMLESLIQDFYTEFEYSRAGLDKAMQDSVKERMKEIESKKEK